MDRVAASWLRPHGRCRQIAKSAVDADMAKRCHGIDIEIQRFVGEPIQLEGDSRLCRFASVSSYRRDGMSVGTTVGVPSSLPSGQGRVVVAAGRTENAICCACRAAAASAGVTRHPGLTAGKRSGNAEILTAHVAVTGADMAGAAAGCRDRITTTVASAVTPRRAGPATWRRGDDSRPVRRRDRRAGPDGRDREQTPSSRLRLSDDLATGQCTRRPRRAGAFDGLRPGDSSSRGRRA